MEAQKEKGRTRSSNTRKIAHAPRHYFDVPWRRHHAQARQYHYYGHQGQRFSVNPAYVGPHDPTTILTLDRFSTFPVALGRTLMGEYQRP